MIGLFVTLYLALLLMSLFTYVNEEKDGVTHKPLTIYTLCVFGGVSFLGSFLLVSKWSDLTYSGIALEEIITFAVLSISALGALYVALRLTDWFEQEVSLRVRKLVVYSSTAAFLASMAMIGVVYITGVSPVFGIITIPFIPHLLWSVTARKLPRGVTVGFP